MEAIDFLTILGIGIALWQFISPRERKIIGLYFSPFEIRLAILLIVFIHYLFAFEWLLSNWFPCLSFFTYKKGIPPNTFAYLVSLLLILYPVLKIKYGFFSKSRRESLIKWYKQLLKDEEIDLLVNYIKKYHLEDIKSFLSAYSELPEEDHLFHREPEEETERSRAFDKIINKPRVNFAQSVYYRVLRDRGFIEKTTPKYPTLFAEIFLVSAENNLREKEFIQTFLTELFNKGNPQFIEELKSIHGSLDPINQFIKYHEIPILKSLFLDMRSARVNELWQPFFKLTQVSLKENEKQRAFLQKKYDFQLEDQLWNQPVYITIEYFNCMIRETINQDIKYHMMLHFYDRIVELLIKKVIPENNTEPHPLFAHKLIEEIFDNMLNWFEQAMKVVNKNRVIKILDSLGEVIFHLANANNYKLSEGFKSDLISRLINKWFIFSLEEETAFMKLIRNEIIKILLSPKNPNDENPSLPNDYPDLIKKSRDKIDDYEYRNESDYGQVNDFETKVLMKLN